MELGYFVIGILSFAVVVIVVFILADLQSETRLIREALERMSPQPTDPADSKGPKVEAAATSKFG